MCRSRDEQFLFKQVDGRFLVDSRCSRRWNRFVGLYRRLNVVKFTSNFVPERETNESTNRGDTELLSNSSICSSMMTFSKPLTSRSRSALNVSFDFLALSSSRSRCLTNSSRYFYQSERREMRKDRRHDNRTRCSTSTRYFSRRVVSLPLALIGLSSLVSDKMGGGLGRSSFSSS